MASRVPRKTLLKSFLYFSRRLNSAASSSSAAAAAAVSPLSFAEKPDATMATVVLTPDDVVLDRPRSTSSSLLSFDDYEKLFATVPTAKMVRASANLQAAAMEPMVDLGMWVMRSRLMETEVVRDLILGTIRHTFYEHFCAGEDSEAAGRTVFRLKETGIRGMPVYALEYAAENDACESNLDCFIRTVRFTKSLPPSSASFIMVKISAICPMRVLESVSDLLRWQHQDPSCHLPWKLDSLPIFSDSSPMYHTLQRPEPLTPEEERDLQLGHERLLKLCQECAEANIPLAVEAEHTAVQPAIDYLTYASAIIHNKKGDSMPIVYGTIQAYLKDAKERLLLASNAADKMGIPMGFKAVRGAYMSSETKTVASLGYESPIHNSIQDTHDCYNDCASFILDKIANGSGGLVLATHNFESGKLAAAKAHELGIEKVKHRLEFAQLYGMADSLSFGLKNAGFQVSKYMPFGPIDMVIPYLLRRAEENKGVLSASTVDRQLMRKELKRRLKAVIM